MNRNKIITTMGMALGIFISGGLPAQAPKANLLMIAQENAAGEAAAAAGKDVCPVSGEEIGKETNITYEYKGKTYRFCCPSCVEEFKKDPEKYMENMKKQDKNNSK